MRDHGIELVAIYHSHPTSDAVPSRKDCADNAYGDSVMHLIISLHEGQRQVNAWWLASQKFWAGKWEFAEDSEIAVSSKAKQ
jgi:proteasome lid subunit RPN8/RPN11